jgi:hypothetical protein
VDWPNWSGETAVIVATGPSASLAPLDEVRGLVKVIAVKVSWRLCPWADGLYGIDRSWWVAHRGVPEFSGRKFSPSPSVCNVYRDVTLVHLKTRAEILTTTIGVLGCGLPTGGGHSGFQALNLAVQFGAKRIVLVGFDMTLNHGAHWHNDNRGEVPAEKGRVNSWRESMDGCAGQIERLGVEVINASAISALRNYRKAGLLEAVAR